VQNTVPAANIQAAASQEGASSRVITAISNNAGEITYLSYGWQADTATVYEAQVVTTSPTAAPTAAASLAAWRDHLLLHKARRQFKQ
jgi:ABC-type phosphate transport system substrate-binding protein